jgi:hypothetical protein
MMYEHKLARGQAILSAFPKEQARQPALEQLTYWIRTLLPGCGNLLNPLI